MVGSRRKSNITVGNRHTWYLVGTRLTSNMLLNMRQTGNMVASRCECNVLMGSRHVHIIWRSVDCTVEQKDYFAQLTAAVKIDLGLEIQSLPKCPFLTVFSKIYCPTKNNVPGNWEISILFRDLCRFFFVLCRGTLNYIPKFALQLMP